MVASYVVDGDLFEEIKSENELDSFLAKSNRYFDTISRRSYCLDCNDSGIFSHLKNEYQDLREIIEDDFVRTNLESFWIRHIAAKYIFIPDSCSCDDYRNCTTSVNVNSIIKKTNIRPRFIVTYKQKLNVDKIPVVDLNYFDSNVFYCDCRDNTSTESQAALDDTDGDRIIKMNWEELINICSDEIIILDRNIFGFWNDNFKTGLAQFARIIKQVNPALKLKLITRKERQHLKLENTSDYDIYRYIKEKVNSMTDVKIEVILCNTMEHQRYILFDEYLGAELNRGLDTFVPRVREDNIKITYHYIRETINKRNKALSTRIQSGEFKPIKNY